LIHIHHFFLLSSPCFSRAHIPAIRYIFHLFRIFLYFFFLATPFFFNPLFGGVVPPDVYTFSSVIFWAGAVTFHTFV